MGKSVVDSLKEVLNLYARRGVDEWRNAPREIREAADRYVTVGIADKQAEIGSVFKDQGENYLVPMPRVKGIDWCFFKPISPFNPSSMCSFDVLLLCGKKTLGLRFEPSEKTSSTHGYTHVQFSRKLDHRSRPIRSVPDWLPTSYPAVPVRATNSLELFLSLGVAMHGFPDGMADILRDIFRSRNRTREALRYIHILPKLVSA